MLTPAETVAIVVTRGDVQIEPVLYSLGMFSLVIVWDNSKEETDEGVWGRYAALERVPRRVKAVYVQDDDCTTAAAAIVRAYEPGRVVANMPLSFRRNYPDSAMVGFGAVFDRGLAEQAFARYCAAYGDVADDLRVRPDVIFAALNPRTIIDVGVEHLPWTYAPNRMYRQPGHSAHRRRVLENCRKIRRPEEEENRVA